MSGFESIVKDEIFVNNLNSVGITTPTSIQMSSFEPIVGGRNIAISSKTGSGKTFGYLLPLLSQIDHSTKDLQLIIVAPTYELILQISENLKILVKGSELRSQQLIGNVSIKRQIENLKKKPHIIIASPGRLLELVKLKKVKPHTVKHLVIDEVDRMVDKHNYSQTESIVKLLQKRTQYIAVSATIGKECINLLKRLEIEVDLVTGDDDQENLDITHQYIVCEKRENLKKIREISKSENFKGIIFFNDANRMVTLEEKLNYHQIPSVAIHGSMDKFERESAIRNFRSGKVKILITSDLSARGLDFKDVTHVINHSMPKDRKTYLHRAGRTGRAGKSGIAITLVDPFDLKRFKRMILKDEDALEVE